jgi:hypothetical protein
LWNSRYFEKLGWSLAAGCAIVLLPRWGESAGDAIPPLLVVAPMTVVYCLISILKKKGSVLLGLVPFLCVVIFIFPFEWLEMQFLHYVLDEANLTKMDGNSVYFGIRSVIYNCAQSLMLPTLFILALTGMIFPRKRGISYLWLMSGVFPIFIAASLSQKNYDYYLSAVLPVLWVLIAQNSQRGWQSILCRSFLLYSAISWVGLRHLDIDELSIHIPTYVLQDINITEVRIPSQHMFQSWRQTGQRDQIKRDEVAHWLQKGEGNSLLAALPTQSLVLVYDSDFSDVIQVLSSIQRPDILFHKTSKGRPVAITQHLVSHYEHGFVAMGNSVSQPCALPFNWEAVKSIRKAESMCLWKIK